MSYSEFVSKAAEQLSLAAQAVDKRNTTTGVPQARTRIAEVYVALAALERGLPPEQQTWTGED